MVLIKTATEPHIVEALGWYDVIAILQVIGGIIGVCHDDDIIAYIVVVHGVIAYNDTIMPAPVYIVDDDRHASLEVVDDELGQKSVDRKSTRLNSSHD